MRTSRSAGCQPSPGVYRRTTLAGAPTSTAWSGNSPRTTDAAPTTRVAAEPRAGQHDRPGAEPRPVADHDRVVGGPLLPDRHVGVGVHVVLVGDVAVRPGDDVVADGHRAMGDDVAGPPDRAAIADAQHRAGGAGRERLPGSHAHRQAHVGGEQRGVTDGDVLLAEHVAGRERHQGALAEVVVPAGDPVLRPDRARPLQPAPQAVGRVGRHVPPPRVQGHGLDG